MKPVIKIEGSNGFRMRTITKEDIELLREWKNDHRQFFFYDKLIGPEQQQMWYSQFAQRSNDVMFIILVEGHKVGCIGTRLLSPDDVDIYNVILGEKTFEGKGIMSTALNATSKLNRLLYPTSAIHVRVLLSNPAVAWYKKNGFVTVDERDNYVLMVHKDVTLGSTQLLCTMMVDLPFER